MTSDDFWCGLFAPAFGLRKLDSALERAFQKGHWRKGFARFDNGAQGTRKKEIEKEKEEELEQENDSKNVAKAAVWDRDGVD